MFSQEQYLQYMALFANGKKTHPKSKFTPAEDEKLKSIVNEIGEKHWDIISKRMGTRNPRQCKERWFNYLSPKINSLPWTKEEDQKLENLYNEYGSKWVKITQFFPARTDINIKNRWMVLQRQKKILEKKAKKQEIEDAINQNDELLKESSVSSPENVNQAKEINEKPLFINSKINLNNNAKNDDIFDEFSIFDEQFNIDPFNIMNDQCFDYF